MMKYQKHYKEEEDAMEQEGIKAYEREQGKIENQKSIISNMLSLNIPKEEILKLMGIKSQEYDKIMSV